MTYVHSRKHKKKSHVPQHDHNYVEKSFEDFDNIHRPSRLQMPFVSASEFKVGDVIHVDVPSRAPTLFPNKKSGTLCYHVVNKAVNHTDPPQYFLTTSNENGLSAEVNHCPRYPLSPETDRLTYCGEEIDLSAMRMTPYYDRRIVTVVRVLDRKLVVE